MGMVPRSPARPWHPPHTLFPLKEELLLDAAPPHLDATELGHTHTPVLALGNGEIDSRP